MKSGTDEENNHIDNPDPFLLFGSTVIAGHGNALVCAVGDQTYVARKSMPHHHIIDDHKKHSTITIEKNLQYIRRTISAYALVVASLCVLIQVAISFIFHFSHAFDHLIIPLLIDMIIYIVIVPEGIQLALRSSVNNALNEAKS